MMTKTPAKASGTIKILKQLLKLPGDKTGVAATLLTMMFAATGHHLLIATLSQVACAGIKGKNRCYQSKKQKSL
jgi:hypothetical protein